MPDFKTLLQKPAGEAKKPPALPAGDYPGIIKAWELGDNNKNKTPYVRFTVGLVAAPADVEMPEGVDLAKRQMRRDYYLTDDALWRLDEFLRSLNLGGDGRSYEETLPEAQNASVLASVKQELNQTTNDVFNSIDKLVGAV